MQKQKIIVIVGPTASGKTSLSIELAKRFDGEIVSADSRQVYQGLNIGTGKVTSEEMQGVPHHLIDVADPEVTYTVTDYVRDARTAITDIVSRGKTPIIVGGTFFYIDALLGKVSSPEVPPNETLREHLEMLSTEELFSLVEQKDPKRALTIDKNNPRRLIRALEIIEALGKVPEIEEEELYDTLTLGISLPQEILKQNIHKRLIQRTHAGMIDEVVSLEEDGLPFTRLEALGIEYKYIAEYLQGKISDEEMFSQIETKSWQYAKRQMTWLKRNTDIVWINPSEMSEIEGVVSGFFNKI